MRQHTRSGLEKGLSSELEVTLQVTRTYERCEEVVAVKNDEEAFKIF